MNKCRHCKKIYLRKYLMCDSKYKYKNKMYLYFTCKSCNSLRSREYRKTDGGKKVYREIAKKQYSKYRKKILARTALNSAVKNKKIKKPYLCSNCNTKKLLDGHHNDYSKPLEVIWLCRSCHSNLHNNEKTV